MGRILQTTRNVHTSSDGVAAGSSFTDRSRNPIYTTTSVTRSLSLVTGNAEKEVGNLLTND
jgi:hypothetical protein